MSELEKKLQAILFWKNEPVSVSDLAKLLKEKPEAIRDAATALQQTLSSTGIVLILEGDDMRLAADQESSVLIDELEKSERSKELSKAALETLAIILYKGPIRRSEIDYIRGVNSQFIVRHLEIRGLVEKEQSKDDARVFLYKATLDLLAHLGLQNRTELPEYDVLLKKLEEASEPIAEETPAEESQ